MAPPALGLGLGLSRSAYFSGLDPDAAAYIAAVETALSSSISGTQKNAINTFFKAGKADGWYSSLKRVYLPIWADASANALCMVSGTSGTFPVPSGVDQSNVGYIQGDGATGYFNMGVSPLGIGMTEDAFYMAYLTLESLGISKTVIGARTNIGAHYVVGTNVAGSTYASVGDNEGGQGSFDVGVGGHAGILSCSKLSTARHYANRTASGWSILASDTASYISGDSTYNLYGLAQNTAGTASVFTDRRIGMMAVGTGLSQASDQAFTLALKNLWETASELTLP